MSLDVYLCDDDGKELYSSNITHNLNQMAEAANIYECLWRPEEIGITKARQIIEPLSNGLAMMVTNRKTFEAYDSPNGWGRWIHFVPWCASYLQACRDFPNANVTVSR